MSPFKLRKDVKPLVDGVWLDENINARLMSVVESSFAITFSKGASLNDPARLCNSSLDGNVRRAIDINEGKEVDESAFKALVRQAVALNSSGTSKPSKKAKS